MSVIVIAVATESGVPIFSRKRGNSENVSLYKKVFYCDCGKNGNRHFFNCFVNIILNNILEKIGLAPDHVLGRVSPEHDLVQFSTIASLHGINMFSKCHNLTMMNTQVDNGKILWKEYCKSVTLIGVATGGLECDLELLLSCIHDVMILCIGKKELENLKNIDQVKRDLRQCYPILDYLTESLDPNTSSSPLPTLALDLIQSILCPQAQQLQQALDHYAESVTGRWACLSINGHLVATSSDFQELDPREARLLLLLAAAQDGAPLRDTPVFLPQMSPNVAFRAVTCKLLADVYILVICGATPALSQIDEIVLQCWEGYAQIIKEAKLVYPRNFPMSISFEPSILAILAVNISKQRCVFSRHLNVSNQKTRSMSGPHRTDILRTFYVTTARQLAPELKLKDSDSKDDWTDGVCETYWSSEYHKCHAQRSGNIMCCVLYSSTVPTHTMRLITTQILQDINSNKEIFW